MTLSEHLTKLQNQYSVQLIDLDPWHDQSVYQREAWLKKQLMFVYKSEYQINERVVLTLTRGDVYHNNSPAGKLILDLARQLNEIDISNFLLYFLLTILNLYQMLASGLKKILVKIQCQLI